MQETDPALYRVIAYTYDSQGNKVEEAYGQQEVERDVYKRQRHIGWRERSDLIISIWI